MRSQNIPTYTKIALTGFVNNSKYITYIFNVSNLKAKLRPETGSIAYRTGYCNIKTCHTFNLPDLHPNQVRTY